MNEIAIKVEDVSKQYRLGLLGSKTIAEDIKKWWYSIRGKENPFLKIGDENRLDIVEGEYIWALKNINFEIPKGEVYGIIGKNGAGKSTILKLLSKVTNPTTGSIKIKGRIASLLEVGTGFHPDLTGKENVFLNGAILGMTKKEIKSKFDEIIDFSGIGKYIDTPVKRYSSGMYVRLAFAVAAHLDPEILVVDEVLAVGDIDFQKKALGKMGDISKGQGRTILFVSHNMDAIKNLCKNTILLDKGKILDIGPSNLMVQKYINTNFNFNINFHKLKENERGDEFIKVNDIRLIDETGKDIEDAYIDQKIAIKISYEIFNDSFKPLLNLNILSIDEKFLAGSISNYRIESGPGKYTSTVWIPENFLNNERYILSIGIFTEYDSDIIKLNSKVHFYLKDAIIFEVKDSMDSITRKYYKRTWDAPFRLVLNWTLNKEE
ncbi:MAG: ABC transporter ATP-binding protein [Bacteroidales bacterium]|nr:ABC transporter ATP-binding protein [Bacteroidales bacterium]